MEVGFTGEKSVKNGISLQLQQFSGCSVSSAGRLRLYFRRCVGLAEAYQQPVVSVREAWNWGGGRLVLLLSAPEFGQQL